MKRTFLVLSILLLLVLAMTLTACGSKEPAVSDTRPLIVVLGDSGSEGGGSSLVKIEDIEHPDKLNAAGTYNFKRTDGSYISIAGQIMGYRVENFSTGGYTTADVIAQIRSNKFGCADELKKADYIYIGLLNNEYISEIMQVSAEAKQNKYSRADKIISRLYQFDWPELMKMIRELNPNAPIIVNNFLSYYGYWTGNLDDLKGSDGTVQATYRLWKNVALRYLKEHPDAYYTVDLTGRETLALSYSNEDSSHPNDRYNMKLALGTVNSFSELGFYTRNDAQEAENLKAYIPELWDGFNRYMAYLRKTQIDVDVAVDAATFSQSVADMTSLSDVAEAYCEMYTAKDPRPVTE